MAVLCIALFLVYKNSVIIRITNNTTHDLDYLLVMSLESKTLPLLKSGEDRWLWLFPQQRQRFILAYPRVNNAPAELIVSDFEAFKGGYKSIDIH